MIEVGHPFSRPFEGLVDSLVTSLQLGVEQPDTQELLFRTGTFAYPLRDAGTVSGLAAQITGFVASPKAQDVAPTLDNTSDEVEPPAEHLDLTSPRPVAHESRGRDL